MDNDDAIVGRIFTRREALIAAAKAGFGLALTGGIARAAIRQPAPRRVHLVASPALTEGPFFVDENLNRSDLTAGTTRAAVRDGVPLALSFAVYKLADAEFKPLPGAHVDVWHADAHGVYSDESNPMNHEDTSGETWLRGYQVADRNGAARFKTIVPGWYMGRAAHIHFKIRQFSAARQTAGEFTSQLFFDDALLDHVYAKEPYRSRGARDLRNRDDGIFNERQVDGAFAGSHLLLKLDQSPKTGGYAAHFAVALTDETLHGHHDRFPGGHGGGRLDPDG